MRLPHFKIFDNWIRCQTRNQKYYSTYQPSISPIKFILTHFKKDKLKLDCFNYLVYCLCHYSNANSITNRSIDRWVASASCKNIWIYRFAKGRY